MILMQSGQALEAHLNVHNVDARGRDVLIVCLFECLADSQPEGLAPKH